MSTYLTEAAYQRWFRQYQTTFGFYIDVLNDLKVRFDALPETAESDKVRQLLDDMDEHLEAANPRNFNSRDRSLEGFEKLLENLKVLVNLFYRIRGRGDRFGGIYEAEKNRVKSVHETFQFKEKMAMLKEKIEALEAAETTNIPVSEEQL